jgi:thioredoxin-dependent peroxiredoxin
LTDGFWYCTVNPKSIMKLHVNQQAPVFSTQDVYGNEISLQKLKGSKVYLTFERNAGCPVCNLRTHELLKQSEHLKANDVTVVMIYESPVEKMKEYLGENSYPFHFVADPQNKIYNLYGVERSLLKVMRGLFHGLMNKARLGTKLFKKPMKQDGHVTRIPAEFVIDGQAKLTLVHYGRFVGDHLQMNSLSPAITGYKPVATP